jgi:ATP-dependent helicase HrpB
MKPLPIDDQLPALIDALANNSCAAVRAPTGAGKTTRVPPALLQAGQGAGKQIVLLQPRRIAARAAAARMAEEHGTPLGSTIGYEVRFERRASGATTILAVTDGVFLRMLQADPFLERVGTIIFDEFHERNLNADLALGIVRQVQTSVRPDLKLIVMSATLDVEPVAKYLGDCPVIQSEGRLFPVEIEYAAEHLNGPIPVQTAQAVESLLDRTPGDVLAFLPGVGEIRRTSALLADFAQRRELKLCELYGDLPLERQQAVLAPADRRKIVLSTNVAETSLTIEGVTGVVDSGWARVLRRDPNLGINRLELERISKASADQRAGRAGRLSAGACLRLWTRAAHQHLPAHDEPQIRRTDLTGTVLEVLAWGEPRPLDLPWFEPPANDAVEQAMVLLRLLGAVDERGITELGRTMARFPIHPRIARVVIEGARHGFAERVAVVGAMLSERDVFERGDNRRRGDQAASRKSGRIGSDSDVLDRLEALEEFAATRQTEFEIGRINVGAAKFTLRSAEQILKICKQEVAAPTSTDLSSEDVILRAVAAGYLDRLAKRRNPHERRALMMGGRGVRLIESSAVTSAELFVCADIQETGGGEAIVRAASAVDRGWLPTEQFTSSTDVAFDAERERVIGLRTTRFGDLVIEQAPTNLPDDVDASSILAKAAAERLDLTTLLDESSRQLIARVKFLREHLPELEWPNWEVGVKPELLRSICTGKTSFAELRKTSASGALLSQLTNQQMAALAREAPDQLAVPSGSCIALRYEIGKPPVLSVRIQEIFGWRETPRIARGCVAVVLELLGPNYRPQQITTDLASFWRTTYAEVRKELKRRYPKHAWPEDPLTAAAERRPQPKR